MVSVFLRIVLSAVLLVSFSNCKSPEKKAEQKKKEDEAWKHADDADDVAFKAFVGRLRKAVANKDVRTMSTMMTEDFGYSWDPGSDGYGCFKYWDENNLWPELQRVVNSPFVSNGGYLTAPPEFVQNNSYRGFRAGIKVTKNGAYKFAYFVPSQETPMAEPPRQGN